MTYITTKLAPYMKQMSLEDFLFGADDIKCEIVGDTTNTRTISVETTGNIYTTDRLASQFGIRNPSDVKLLIAFLEAFNRDTESLREKPRETLYESFHIPKKSGGLRKIDKPSDELMEALRQLKYIFEHRFNTLYHTSAFAYIPGRCTIDAIKRHQANKSKWFAKFDLSNFFGNTTLDYAMKMFSMVYPFSEIVKLANGREELEKALELAFLNGGLPQGTPVSPIITNIMMIPVDHALSNKLRDFNKQKYIYTRYADDFIVSSRYDFRFRDIEEEINNVLKSFEAPFELKKSKTRYGSSAGSNWNLGVMLNANNEITVGYKKKRQLQNMLHRYITDKKNGTEWDLSDIMTMNGYIGYYRMVEGEVIDKIIEHVSTKHNVDVCKMIKEDLNKNNS